MIQVVFKSYHDETPVRGYWDYAMIEDLLSSEFGDVPFREDIKIFESFYGVDFEMGAVIILPARHHANDIERINFDISKFPWVFILLLGDEEQVFPVDKLVHKNKKVWVMTPHINKYSQIDGYIPNGYTPHTSILKGLRIDKTRDWFFAGQNTHVRRNQCINAIKDVPRGKCIETTGFTQGIDKISYMNYLANAKVALCPSGAVVQDTFRLYEALEAGCVPIADALSPKESIQKGFFELLFGDNAPFPIIEDWNNAAGTIAFFVDTFPKNNNKIFAWWQLYKRNFAVRFFDTINALRETKYNKMYGLKDKITVLIPTSPIKSHPSTEIIEKTIKSIRERVPYSEIFIMFDGVREEQKDMEQNYEEYKRRIIDKTRNEYKNVYPVVFDNHMHQAAMTREVLKLVKTPTILFVEHDTPICEEIPFNNIADTIINNKADMVRLHHEALILPDHAHLMFDKEPMEINGVPFIRTMQWSQRPHVAGTEFYKRILLDNFSENSRTMIEDKMHGVVMQACSLRKLAGWNDYRVMIYAPAGDMKRSYHLDGRAGESKFEMKF